MYVCWLCPSFGIVCIWENLLRVVLHVEEAQPCKASPPPWPRPRGSPPMREENGGSSTNESRAGPMGWGKSRAMRPGGNKGDREWEWGRGKGGCWVIKVWFASSFCAEIFGVKVNLIVIWGGENDELSWWKSHDFLPADVWGRSPEVRSPRRATLWQFWSRSESLIRMKGISSYWICNVM